MKKLFYLLGSLLALIFLAILFVPYFFRDDIVGRINQEIESQLNAQVNYNPDDFSLSLLQHFPELSVQTGKIQVINKAPFDQDTLASIDRLTVTVDLFDLMAKHIEIKQIYFHRPIVNVKVLENGTANYDIVKEQPTKASNATNEKKEESSEKNDFKLSINHWELLNADISYVDLSSKIDLEAKGINHKGSGNFSLNLVDLSTETAIKSLSFSQGPTKYVNKKRLLAELEVALDLPNNKFTFKENKIKLEELALGFEGDVALLPKDAIQMDVEFHSQESSFESLLSLVPKSMLPDLSDIETKGNFSFDGKAKGIYTENQLPAFSTSLAVKDAYAKYKKLPEAVKNIQIDVKIENNSGVIEDTKVDLKSFHADFGNNPLDASLIVKDLKKYPVDGSIKTRFDLSEASKFYPMEGISTSGILDANVKFNGYYDSLTNHVPTIDANISLKNGSIKTSELPAPVEEINFESSVKNTTGNLENTSIEVSSFHLKMNKEQFDATLNLTNPVDPNWDFNVNGKINLALLESTGLLEKGTKVAGMVSANLKSSGILSDLKAKKYDKLSTKGNLSLKEVSLTDKNLPSTLTIPQASLSLDNRKMILANFKAIIGKSDVLASGYLKNYLAYALDTDVELEGKLDINSNYVDANAFMTSTAPADTTQTSTKTKAPVKVDQSLVLIPKDLNLVMNLNMNRIDYDNLKITKLTGKLEVDNQLAKLSNLDFKTLDASIKMNGNYNSKNTKRPSFRYDLDIKDLSIQKGYQAFNTIKKLAPVAENLRGKCNMALDINGFILPGMNPDLKKLNGTARVAIKNASIVDSDLIKNINKLAKISSDKARLEDVDIKADIKNGKVITKPFDVKIGEYNSIFSGTNDFLGNINYNIALYVPTKGISETINTFLSQLTKNSSTKIVGSTLVTDFQVKGKYDSPKIKIKGIRAINEEQKETPSSSSTKKSEGSKKQDEELKKAVEDAAKKAKELFKGLF